MGIGYDGWEYGHCSRLRLGWAVWLGVCAWLVVCVWQWFFLHSCVGQWSSSSLERRGSERGLPLLLLPCGWPLLPLASSSLPLLLPTLCCYSTPPVCHPSIYLIYISLRARVRACVCVRVCAWAGWLAAWLGAPPPSPSSLSTPQQPLSKKKRGCTVRALPQWSPT